MNCSNIILVENAAKQNETKTDNHTEVQQKQRELRVTASIHALNKAKDNVDEHQEREAAAEAALLEQDIERHEEEEKETKKRAKEAQEAKDKAEKEVKAAQEKAQQAKEQAARAEAAHDKAEASAQAEAKRLADVAAALEAKAMEQAKAAAAVAAAAAEKEAKEAQEAKEAEERAMEARRVQAMKEQKEKEEKERREAEEAKVRAIHIALHATLKTSYYATKKTELFKKIMNRYGGKDDESKDQGTKHNALRVIASFRMGSAMDMKAALAAEQAAQQETKQEKEEDDALFANARVIEAANLILQKLETCIDQIDHQAPKKDGGLHAVENGNKMLTKALALHGLMSGEIDELHLALASAEAREAAEADARARGMPKELHWMNEDYNLKKNIAAEEIPNGLFYAPEEAAEVEVQQWMYVPNMTGSVYEPGKVFTPEDGNTETLEVLTDSDTVVTINKSTLKVISIQNMDDEESKPITAKQLDGNAQAYPLTNPEALAVVPNDLMKMSNVNEASVLHVLNARFKRDRFYTSVGPILISINPFKWIDGMYGQKVIQYFVDSRFAYDAEKKRHAETPPHTFAVAERAFIALATTAAENQSILVSGESGAGKSEVAKHCLAYLAAVSMPRQKEKSDHAGSSESRFTKSKDRREEANRNMLMMGANGGGVSSAVVDSIVSAVPILEAYGNAKTVRNDNSSRFGKWLLIHFDSNHSILGCSNISYLLEKTRVVGQEKGERNYHIFYYLLVGAPKELKKELGLDIGGESTVPEICCGPFHYVNQSGTFANHKSDVDKYKGVQNSLSTLGFDTSIVSSMNKIIASILHLGNVTFMKHTDASREASEIETSSMSSLQKTCAFLGIKDVDTFSTALTTMELEIAGSKVNKDLLPNDAVVNRDSCSKTIYSKLFDWLVETINEKCSDPSSEHLRTNFIGILDIFGFEIFEINGFEQVS